MNCTDFYDFPIHPRILELAGYERYCELAKIQTKCFVEKCQDRAGFDCSTLESIRLQAAERVFSPSNFLCNFKKDEFMKVRPCLEETEPLTFLKCDHQCHQNAMKIVKQNRRRANLGKVCF